MTVFSVEDAKGKPIACASTADDAWRNAYNSITNTDRTGPCPKIVISALIAKGYKLKERPDWARETLIDGSGTPLRSSTSEPSNAAAGLSRGL